MNGSLSSATARAALLCLSTLVGCSYPVSDFAIGSGDATTDTSPASDGGAIDSSTDDTTIDDAGGDDTTVVDSATDDSTVVDSRVADSTTIDVADSAPVDSRTDTAGDASDASDASDAPIDGEVDAPDVSDTPTCPSGTTTCGSPATCSATSDDPLHCSAVAGSCGVSCAGSQFCRNGSCECRPGLVNCGGGCVDISGDQNFCGTTCGSTVVCSGGGAKLCTGGACSGAVTSCSGGRTKCDKSCFDLNSDANHCGACTTACAATELCIAGACRPYVIAIDCASSSSCDCPSILAGSRACDPLTGSTGHPFCVQASFCPVAPWK